MTPGPPEGISIAHDGDRVIIEVSGGRWEGDAAEAERLLTRLHYEIGRARPGTNIASVFLNDKLWGGKVLEEDPREARRLMRDFVAQLAEYVASYDDESEES